MPLIKLPSLILKFPAGRPLSEIEALYAVGLDHANDRGATLAGYASQWGWSRDKVRSFLARIGCQIEGASKDQAGRLVWPEIDSKTTPETPISNDLQKESHSKTTSEIEIDSKTTSETPISSGLQQISHSKTTASHKTTESTPQPFKINGLQQKSHTPIESVKNNSNVRDKTHRGSGGDLAPLPDWLNLEAWQDWCADRKERRMPLTQRAKDGHLLVLKRYAMDKEKQARCVAENIDRGYRKLVPLEELTWKPKPNDRKPARKEHQPALELGGQVEL